MELADQTVRTKNRRRPRSFSPDIPTSESGLAGGVLL